MVVLPAKSAQLPLVLSLVKLRISCGQLPVDTDRFGSGCQHFLCRACLTEKDAEVGQRCGEAYLVGCGVVDRDSDPPALGVPGRADGFFCREFREPGLDPPGLRSRAAWSDLSAAQWPFSPPWAPVFIGSQANVVN